MSAILDKATLYAEEKEFDVSILLHSTPFPDQFSPMRQIQFRHFQIKERWAT